MSQLTLYHPIILLHEKTGLKKKKTDSHCLSSFRISPSFGEGKAVFSLKWQHRQHMSEPEYFGGVNVSPRYSTNRTLNLVQTSHLI